LRKTETECSRGTEHVTRTGLCKSWSCQERVTRKGNAIPGDRRQEVKTATGPKTESRRLRNVERPEKAQAEGRSGTESESRKFRRSGRRKPEWPERRKGCKPGKPTAKQA